ncbi:MAG: glycosyltransferase family 2 protein [Pseudomonadota bacterium]
MDDHRKFNMPYVVVFVPAHNEEGSIGRVIEAIDKSYRGDAPRDYVLDIVVVDDGSSDETARIARQMKVKRVISHPYNRGLGAATRTGMQVAYEMEADVAVKIDADFQHDPEDIERVIRPILEDRADCVFGSRFLGGLQYKMPLYRSLGNKFFGWMTGTIIKQKVTDGQTGLMAFNRRYLSRFTILRDYNETQQLIIDSWGKGMRVIEVSVLFHKRVSGQSFISWKYPLEVIPSILRACAHANPLRVFLTLGLAVTLTGVLIAAAWISGLTRFPGDAAASILIVVGAQIILFGFLADIIKFNR